MNLQRKPLRATNNPRPPKWPLFGHVGPYLRDKLGFLQRTARDYGDVVELDLGPRTFLLSNAADLQHVVQTCAERYQKGSGRMTEAGRRLAGRGLLTSGGTEHLNRKRILQPLFTQATMARFGSVITDLTIRRAERWGENAEIDMELEMLSLTQDVSGLALLGQDYQTDAPGFAAAIQSWRRYLQYWFDYPLPFRDRLPLPVVWRHRRARRLIQETLTRHLHKRKTAGGDDLLTMLARLSGGGGDGLTDQEIVDEAHTIALTAYDTVAEAITWTLYLLSQHPDVESRVLEELRDSIGQRQITADDYQKLPYLRRVIAESLRLYPPSWLFTRVALQDDQLPSGATIPMGVTLFLTPWVVHRRELYFPDPTRFDPDRFSDQAEASRPAFAYLPFGAGRHVCIGQALARIECVLILATILPTHRLELADKRPIVPDPRMTLRPKNGLRMRIQHRT